ncbi:CDP-diacylglycerol--glycerol-3-phosphate 3-phosphatidyltransferase [Lutimaribacter marinistellae]|uniref:CDP-diacylglycerol--glycerol-3-phosphate 3-phosphatidyltransferase n=1 Tax=Lutimaribacter marinistellae TaxID=1820329 RepID=A0ABV7TI24_9RHOB
MIWNLPNILTLLRLLAAPALAVMFLYFDRPYADWFALILFAGASITDWIDGYLARAWKQETKMGAMLDPIADKAMVVIALMILVGYSHEHWTPWLVLPATVILFREVFVSGLREFLGDVAGTLKVTKLAKWKTTLQMVAIAVLFAQGIFEHYGNATGASWTGNAGLVLIWIAAALTLITGVDYLRKAMPHLKETS